MQVLPAQRQEENYAGRYWRGLRNQNGKYVVNLCKSNIIETTYWELARTLLPVKSTNNIKGTHHRVIGDWGIWERISLMNACWASQSVFYEVLNGVSDCLFKRKCLMEK